MIRGSWGVVHMHFVRVLGGPLSFTAVTVASLLLLLPSACGRDAATTSSEGEQITTPSKPTDSANSAEISGVTCAEWERRVVTADEVEYGCDQGENNIAGTATFKCDDGRTLYWNDAGWGYVGEPMHAHEPGGELVAPEPERTACDA